MSIILSLSQRPDMKIFLYFLTKWTKSALKLLEPFEAAKVRQFFYSSPSQEKNLKDNSFIYLW